MCSAYVCVLYFVQEQKWYIVSENVCTLRNSKRNSCILCVYVPMIAARTCIKSTVRVKWENLVVLGYTKLPCWLVDFIPTVRGWCSGFRSVSTDLHSNVQRFFLRGRLIDQYARSRPHVRKPLLTVVASASGRPSFGRLTRCCVLKGGNFANFRKKIKIWWWWWWWWCVVSNMRWRLACKLINEGEVKRRKKKRGVRDYSRFSTTYIICHARLCRCSSF